MSRPSHEDLRVIAHIANCTPARLRELLYCCDPTAYSRAHMKRLYRDRGSLIAECYARYHNGDLKFLVRETLEVSK